MEKKKLQTLYIKNNKSAKEIADSFGFSQNKVNYWMKKHNIKKRTISDAIYLKNNPDGDPFLFVKPKTPEDFKLLGMGLGLYWGEGTKADKVSVRLGNTDPKLIKTFMFFLIKIFSVKKKDLHFSLQIFSDMPKQEALTFWTKYLGVNEKQFYKTTVTVSGKIGTYRQKTKHGVLIMYYHNKKFRDLLVSML